MDTSQVLCLRTYCTMVHLCLRVNVRAMSGNEKMEKRETLAKKKKNISVQKKQ